MLDRIKSAQQNVRSGNGPEKYKDFLDSLQRYYEDKGKITHAQESYLISIENQWSNEAVMEEAAWMEQYGADLREVAIKCALYYKAQTERYFHHIVTKVLSDQEGHTLSKREFTKMCMNKYAQKVLDEYQTECKFSVGDLVALRSNNRIQINNPGTVYRAAKISSRTTTWAGMVLEQHARPITRASKGSKVYKVKFIKNPEPLYVCESDIKKLRR